MSALKSLSTREGFEVRVSVDAHSIGGPQSVEVEELIVAIAIDAVDVTRETGIGPAEMRRQRDELLAALQPLVEHVGNLHHVTEPVVGLARLTHAGTSLAAVADEAVPVFDQSAALLRFARGVITKARGGK